MRFCLEIVEAVRDVWPADRPVFMRVSAIDGLNSQWSVSDTVALVRTAKERGVEAVTASSGGISGPGTATLVPRLPGYHVPYAERVRHAAGVKTIAVGLITEARHAEEILHKGAWEGVGPFLSHLAPCKSPKSGEAGTGRKA